MLPKRCLYHVYLPRKTWYKNDQNKGFEGVEKRTKVLITFEPLGLSMRELDRHIPDIESFRLRY